MSPGSLPLPSLAGGNTAGKSYHSEGERIRAPSRISRSELGVVRRPRHFLVFRRTDNGVELLRVIHDARDIQQHVPGESEG